MLNIGLNLFGMSLTLASGGPPLLIVHSFYKQMESVAFQRVQAITILCLAVVAVQEPSSRLDVLPGFSTISLLRGTGDGFRF